MTLVLLPPALLRCYWTLAPDAVVSQDVVFVFWPAGPLSPLLGCVSILSGRSPSPAPPSLPPCPVLLGGKLPSVPTRNQAGVWPCRWLPFAQERRGPQRGIWSLEPRPCPAALRTSEPGSLGLRQSLPLCLPWGSALGTSCGVLPAGRLTAPVSEGETGPSVVDSFGGREVWVSELELCVV